MELADKLKSGLNLSQASPGSSSALMPDPKACSAAEHSYVGMPRVENVS